MLQGQVNLSFALIGQWDVGLDEEVEAREDAALKETGLGLLGAGDGDPYVALLLAERAPTGGHRVEMLTDLDLRGAARIKWDKGGVGVLAIPIALPDSVPAFS